MNIKKVLIALVTGLMLSSVSYAASQEKKGIKVPFPEGYRGWTHIKSMVIKPGHVLENPFQGIHHIYGNDKAVKGMKTGRYKDGSVLVFDLLKYAEKDEALHEKERKLVGVMLKNAQKYPETGGWGFEGFAGNSKTKRLTKDGGFSCYGCHEPQKKSGYVFSGYRK